MTDQFFPSSGRHATPHPFWIPAFAGISMALRWPHERMKIAGCRVGFFHRLVGLPLPTPLDSGLRRNDDGGPD